MEMKYKNLFENNAKAIKNLNLRTQNLLNEIKIKPKIINNTIIPKIAQWSINPLIIKLELTKLSKTKTNPIIFQEKFFDIQNNLPDHHHIYTDESKKGMEVGCAAIFQNQEPLKCLPNESSISSAKVTDIDLAMSIIANHKSSKSVLLALQNKDTSTHHPNENSF